MEQRLTLVTLGVRDLPRSRAFYEALGWTVGGRRPPGRAGAALVLAQAVSDAQLDRVGDEAMDPSRRRLLGTPLPEARPEERWPPRG